MALEMKYGDYVKGGWDLVKPNLVTSIVATLCMCIPFVGIQVMINYLKGIKEAKNSGKAIEIGSLFDFANVVNNIVAFLSWFYAIIFGRMNEGMRNTSAWLFRYELQTYAYIFLLKRMKRAYRADRDKADRRRTDLDTEGVEESPPSSDRMSNSVTTLAWRSAAAARASRSIRARCSTSASSSAGNTLSAT